MNAPLRSPETDAASGLSVFAFFHLNLAFSSIEEERRGEVIARCYWPLLRLAERLGPIGLEASGHTLEEIAARDPCWIEKARSLIARGQIELIGSGYTQMIGPLVPARVTVENLRLGLATYKTLLGARPKLALINEQAYSAGLVGLYRDAGYDAILMDWENPAASHPEWPQETQYRPQRALGNDGRDIGLIWSNTTLFQQLQRFAHGDISLEVYLGFVRKRMGEAPRALCLYASDAEIFDFRPGRFRTEERLSGQGEWARLEEAFAAMTPGMTAPSQILPLMDQPGAGQPLSLESAACPVPVKKQRKYNLARWAVTGRDNLAINAACQRIYEGMLESGEPDWKELCYLWASDFRTHLTEKRWSAYCARLGAAEARWSKPVPERPRQAGAPVTERYFRVETPMLSAMLDRRRGLALASLQFSGHRKPALGGLPHGTFDEIALAADWYTGDCVFEAPGEHKLTDLEWCEPQIAQAPNGDILVSTVIATPKGPIEKSLRFSAHEPRVEFDLTFDWQDWGKGVLRLGHFTLLPDAFEQDRLRFATTNGGGCEEFALRGRIVDHGAPVSFLVSSSHGFGMTEGWVEIGDGKTNLRVEVDRACAPLLGLLTHRLSGDKIFCQLQLSALELDDTRKPDLYRAGPRRFRFAVGVPRP
jgi:Glycosyl hydrolase family 57